MIRATAPCRVFANHAQHGAQQSERIRRQNIRQTLYDSDGNLRVGRLLCMLWNDGRKPFLWTIGIALGFYGYQRLIVYLSLEEVKRQKLIDQQSEAYARQTGKLRSDRYLVKPRRQIDDPDFLNVPSHAGKGVYSSKLFTEETSSTSELHSEYNAR